MAEIPVTPDPEPPLEGLWQSSYEYGAGPDGTLTSEHMIKFIFGVTGWVGVSEPTKGGSVVTMLLRPNTLNGHEFSGEWRETTARKGPYKGQVFTGVLMLLLNAEGNELNGKWLGANSTNEHINAGAWVMRRVTSEAQPS